MEWMERRHKVWVKKRRKRKDKGRGEEEVVVVANLTTHFENWRGGWWCWELVLLSGLWRLS